MGKYSGNHPRFSGQSYDAKEGYNKDLTASARLHYLENSEHDKHAGKMHHGDPVAKMYDEPAKMNDYGDPAMKKELIGKQANLPVDLREKIEAAPESPAMMYGGKKGDESKSKRDYESPAKNIMKEGGLKGMGASAARMMAGGMDSYDITKMPLEEDMTGKRGGMKFGMTK